MTSANHYLAVFHGPNLDRLGERDPKWYGTDTLAIIDAEIESLAHSLGFESQTFQTNVEGEMIDRLHAIDSHCAGVIINAGAWTHTSIAIRDAVSQLRCPALEVHLSNVYAREPFRHKSVLEDIVVGKILGFGKDSYLLAVRALAASHERSRKE